jgi:hypothetical protein
MLLRLTMTGPNTVEGLAIYRFLFDDGPSHGEAAISGTVSNNELVLRLRPVDTGPRGWYLGTLWSGRPDAATGGFTIDLSRVGASRNPGAVHKRVPEPL